MTHISGVFIAIWDSSSSVRADYEDALFKFEDIQISRISNDLEKKVPAIVSSFVLLKLQSNYSLEVCKYLIYVC